MTNIPKTVPESDNQSLQHFISESAWDEEGVITELQKNVTELIGDKDNGSIHIDESGYPKQGKDSVGVKRQYCGRLGKVDNCQVGVFLSYANGKHRALIDKRLYLPKEWIDDAERRKKCGVPEDIEFKNKADLAFDMIMDARNREVPFGWVGMDCFYGNQPSLLDKLHSEGTMYIADIPCDTPVWLEKPKTEVPKRKSRKGRQPTREQLAEGEPNTLQVQEIGKQDSIKWEHVFVRDTERKELWYQIACLRVYPVRKELPGEETWLIIRKSDGENEIKYQLSNAPINITVEKLAQMSASRYWIERAFEDAKGDLGMADYQVRSWLGWHHHMTMTFLSMLFLLRLLLEMENKATGLTIQDIREILEVILPKKSVTEDEILKMLEQKLKAKESARRSHHKINKM